MDTYIRTIVDFLNEDSTQIINEIIASIEKINPLIYSP